MKRRIAFRIDERGKRGSYEHFFHYWMGYVLPSLSKVLEYGFDADCSLSFQSYGPVMDRVGREVFSRLNLEFEICDLNAVTEPGFYETVFVEPWDAYLFAPLIREYETHPKFEKTAKHLARFPNYFAFLKQLDLHGDFSLKLFKVRNWLLDAFVAKQNRKEVAGDEAGIVLLKRSPPPEFYQQTKSGYGTSRRSLKGLPRLKAKLEAEGNSVKIFEAGAQSIERQINCFHRCRAVVGMRGAEFANILFMPPGGQVVMFTAPDKPEPSRQSVLAELCQLKFADIAVDHLHYDVRDLVLNVDP